MSFNWIVRRGEKQSSPVSTQKLKEHLSSGKVQPTDLVRREDQEGWHEARRIKDLLSPETKLSPGGMCSVPPPPPPPSPQMVQVRRQQPSVVLEPLSPSSELHQRRTKACPYCGETVLVEAKKCKHCGEIIDVSLRAAEEAKRVNVQYMPTTNRSEKNKVVAALLAFFLGGLGIHKFYLGQSVQGILYLLFCWTLIPAIIAFLEGICYLTYSDEKFARQYG